MLTRRERVVLRGLRGPHATEWTASRLAAKECVHRLFDVPLGRSPVEVEADADGVPWARAGERLLPIGISHADGWAVAAGHRRVRVGVDVEPLRPIPDELWRYFVDTAELSAFDGWTDRPTASLAAWTVKEAVLKAVGRGLEVPPATVRIGSVDAGGNVRVVLGAREIAVRCLPQAGALVSVACPGAPQVPPIRVTRSEL